MRVRHVVGAGVLLLAFVGSTLAAPPSVVAFCLVLAASTGAAGAWLRHQLAPQADLADEVVTWGTGAAFVAAAVLGGGFLLGATGAVLAVGLAATYLALATAAGRQTRRTWCALHAAIEDGLTGPGLAARLHALTTAEVCRLWHLAWTPHREERHRRVAGVLRSLLFDEIASRDPLGLQQWVASGGKPSQLDRYVRARA